MSRRLPLLALLLLALVGGAAGAWAAGPTASERHPTAPPVEAPPAEVPAPDAHAEEEAVADGASSPVWGDDAAFGALRTTALAGPFAAPPVPPPR